LALVWGKSGSNKKEYFLKCYSIISMNLNLECRVQNPKFAFYQNTLPVEDRGRGRDVFMAVKINKNPNNNN